MTRIARMTRILSMTRGEGDSDNEDDSDTVDQIKPRQRLRTYTYNGRISVGDSEMILNMTRILK